MTDPRVVQQPVVDCGEPLVDLRSVDAIRLADPNGAFPCVRLSVADRLVAAQTLIPRGLRLLVIQGYRPALASHVTGAAVDLTLCVDDGTELEMEARSAETTEYRRTLAVAMKTVGFINHPSEWRHWSYGDQYWAAITNAQRALYGELCHQPET